MKTVNRIKASPQPPPPSTEVSDSRAIDKAQVDKPQGVATRPLQKNRERDNAATEQSILQRKGANALPISGYPISERPPSANPQDSKQAKRQRGAGKNR